MSKIRKAIPWWVRIGAKLLLARLPIGYSLWKQLRLFEHGSMDEPTRALETFLAHARTAGILDERDVNIRLKPEHLRAEFTVLEVGPGDSLFTAMIAKSMGATKTWLVDADDFATREFESYLSFAEFLRGNGFSMEWMKEPDSVSALIADCGGVYLTQGIKSLKQVPASSVNYCFSNAVLEHIPKCQFDDFIFEFARILQPDGISLHRIDLKDHLGGALNNLRFSELLWESRLFRNSGFYTNRIRYSEMLDSFRSAGLDVEVVHRVQWNHLPIPKCFMNKRFSELADDDLLVSGFDVLLKRCLSASLD
jgi:hypothetical protein